MQSLYRQFVYINTKTKGKKEKKASLLNLRPPDMRPYTIFTPPRKKAKRQKGKFTQSETSRFEI